MKLPVKILTFLFFLPMSLFCAVRAVVRRRLLPGRIARYVKKNPDKNGYQVGYAMAPLMAETYTPLGLVEIYGKLVNGKTAEQLDLFTLGVCAWIADHIKIVAKARM